MLCEAVTTPRVQNVMRLNMALPARRRASSMSDWLKLLLSVAMRVLCYNYIRLVTFQKASAAYCCYQKPRIQKSKKSSFHTVSLVVRPTLKPACNWGSNSMQCVRGAKRKSKKSLQDLPQGALALEPLPDEREPAYPTVIQQARDNINKFPHCVVLTRVGSFYELYFETAEEFGPLLNLKVARKKTTGGDVSMAGFPFYQLDRMVKILVQENSRYVAISEEFPNTSRGKVGGLMFDRKVTRIITPGTLIDEKFIDTYENNFLLAVFAAPSPALTGQVGVPRLIGLAWLDLSTGDFFTQESSADDLISDIARISPREVIMNEEVQEEDESPIVKIAEADKLLIGYQSSSMSAEDEETWNEILESPFTPFKAIEFSDLEKKAASMLLRYVRTQLPGFALKLQPPVKKFARDLMGIDANSVRALELKRTLYDSVAKGSLLHTIRRTVTKSGARVLASWMAYPLTSINQIEGRLNIVDHFYHNGKLRQDIIRLLRRTQDSQRLAQRFALGRGNPDDFISLARTIETSQEILLRLKSEVGRKKNSSLGQLLRRFDIPLDLAQRITNAIDEEGLLLQQKIQESETAQLAAMAESVIEMEQEEMSESKSDKLKKGKRQLKKETDTSGYFERSSGLVRVEPWLMLRTASANLGKLHKKLDKYFEQKFKLAEQLQKESGTASLSLKWSGTLGHFVYVKLRDRKAGTLDSIRDAKAIASSRSSRTFQLADWTELGTKIDQTRIQIRAEEQVIFRKLRENIVDRLVQIRRNASVLDELDIGCSFAQLAHEKNFVRPILNTGNDHKIVGGRHPVVETGLMEQGRLFVANDCFVGDEEKLWLITGPNMAGKSTFLRQNAIISILAQMGCYVPADYAEIGVVDQIFSRVGSADNLFRDQSTFMVEMLETANILKKATSRSFVIMDEIGRGTTPIEGVAIAFACLHHLHSMNRSRTLFATHFHDIVDMTLDMKKIGYYCTDIHEDKEGGSFSYIHRLKRGVNRQSHALKVARLAGIPEQTILLAQDALALLRQNHGHD